MWKTVQCCQLSADRDSAHPASREATEKQATNANYPGVSFNQNEKKNLRAEEHGKRKLEHARRNGAQTGQTPFITCETLITCQRNDAQNGKLPFIT